MKKTLYIGFFALDTLSGVIFDSFAGLGLKAGGSSISTADFLGPGRLAQVGLDARHPLLDAASQMMGFTSFFAVAVLMVSWLLVLIAFFILAVPSASAPDCLAVHHHLWRRPADDRAGASVLLAAHAMLGPGAQHR
ncbi:type IV secretory pathway TrbL component [Bradyrhizobium sp. F1.13.1]